MKRRCTLPVLLLALGSLHLRAAAADSVMPQLHDPLGAYLDYALIGLIAAAAIIAIISIVSVIRRK